MLRGVEHTPFESLIFHISKSSIASGQMAPSAPIRARALAMKAFARFFHAVPFSPTLRRLPLAKCGWKA